MPVSIWLLFYLLGGFSHHYHHQRALAADTPSAGINYGMVADNLPPPTEVVRLLQSISISKAKIYSANSSVLRAFGNTGISFIVGIGNSEVEALTYLETASKWVQQNILEYLPHTQISAIAVGNEVYTGNDTASMSNLLLAMKNIHACLTILGLDKTISISTPHSLAVLGNSYPPSAGSFVSELTISYMKPLLLFLSQTGSPFMINAYPYFAYKANPTTVSLDYVLFNAEVGVVDQNSGLLYNNMLDAQVDAIYSAIANLGFKNVRVMVTETGWPSKGDEDEAGANQQNAQAYNSNLIKRLASKKGTPMRPDVPLEAYMFALFNEDSKPGPASERNYGLFLPDGEKAYDFGLDYPISSSTFYTISSDSSYKPLPPRVLYCTLLSSLLAAFISIGKHPCIFL